jgi:DNA polymerase I
LAAVLLGEPPRQKGLKALSKKYLKEDMITFEDVVGEATFEHADMQQAYVYACDDARNTWRLAQILHKRLKDLNLYDYYSKIEVPFTYVIAEMQETGIEIDFEKWKRLAVAESKKIRQIKDSLNIEMKKVNATDLKLSSTKDLRELFFVRLNLKSAGKTPTGLDSTDHQALEKLSSQHSIPKKMIELREATKFYNAFIKSIPRLQKSYDKKLHPTFNHGLVLTGRLSCEDPNIQQWTTGIKAIAQPPDGYTFVGADYSQLELRVLAYMSQDPMLMEPFFLGESVHQSTADLMGVDYKTGKTLNFAVVYGAGAGRIVATAGVSWPMAKSLLKKFNNTYQRVDLFKKEVEDFVLAYGYTETMLGRRRWFPNIRQLRDKDLWKAQREAFNNIIQGTASSDIMKIAMLKLLDEFEGEDVRIFGQIHDEILLLCKESESANVQKRLEQTMINAIDFTPFNIPLEVESHVSKHWDKLK